MERKAPETIEKRMAEITECEATQCAYNIEKKCHTFGITVGGEEPSCDTFMERGRKGGFASMQGGVAACHVDSCQYNNDFECAASGIRVCVSAGHPDCCTYQPR